MKSFLLAHTWVSSGIFIKTAIKNNLRTEKEKTNEGSEIH